MRKEGQKTGLVSELDLLWMVSKKPKVSKQAGASHRYESKKELGTCFQKISFAPAGLAGPYSPRGHPGPLGSSCPSGHFVL